MTEITEETRIGWVTVGEVMELWADAPGEPEDGFQPLPLLLGAAHEELSSYAPRAKFDPGTEPDRVKLAQVLLTQHLWARKRAGDGDSYGAEGYQLSTYPLVMEARDKMKPWRGQFRGLR